VWCGVDARGRSTPSLVRGQVNTAELAIPVPSLAAHIHVRFPWQAGETSPACRSFASKNLRRGNRSQPNCNIWCKWLTAYRFTHSSGPAPRNRGRSVSTCGFTHCKHQHRPVGEMNAPKLLIAWSVSPEILRCTSQLSQNHRHESSVVRIYVNQELPAQTRCMGPRNVTGPDPIRWTG